MDAPAERSRAGTLLTVTAISGFLGILLALGGVAWLARPLATPTQDCGTAFSFLSEGKLNVYVDPANPPKGITAAEAEANNAKPCQALAGDRARPAAGLVMIGTASALLAAIVELAARTRRRRDQRQRPPISLEPEPSVATGAADVNLPEG